MTAPQIACAALGLAALACYQPPRVPSPDQGDEVILSPPPSEVQPSPSPQPLEPTVEAPDTPPEASLPTPTPIATVAQPTTPVVETVVSDADFPVAMAFTPDGRLFYTEKNTGQVRVVVGGQLQAAPVISLPTDGFFERGLLGIAVDPNYEQNHFMWVYHTLPEGIEGDEPSNRVVRFEEHDGVGSDPQAALSVPVVTGAGNHNGGNPHFGLDGMLYVSIGENARPSFAQDPNAIPGKMLRYVPDVPLSVPGDNPVAGNPMFALGLRNSFDFTFDPYSSAIFATENGPNCDDEINLIVGGGNYGWRPDYPCDDADIGPGYAYLPPLLYYTPPEALTGIAVYSGSQLPQWQGDLFYCAWNSGALRRAVLTPARDGIESVEQVSVGSAACKLDVVTGPDGALYFSSDDAIYRIVGQ